MRFHYKTTLGFSKDPPYYGIDDEQTKYCCEEMRKSIYDQIIILGEPDSYYLTVQQEPKSLYLVEKECIEGEVSYNSRPISFCPFCGEMVEIKS